MTTFELVKTVLDELHAQISGDSKKERDALIAKSLGHLSANYNNLLDPKRKPLDYEPPEVRFAYIYGYVTAHGDYIYQIISRLPLVGEMIAKKPLQITCVGGGPGSELIGVLKYASQCKRKEALKCFLCDREQAWAESWCDVKDKLKAGFDLDTIYFGIDITDGETYKHHKKYLASDIFFFSFFFSEIFTFRDKGINYLDHLVACAKQGALFIFIDNNDSRFVEFADEFAKRNGLEVLAANDDRLTPSYDEEKTALGDYITRLGRQPKLQGKIAYRLWRKN